jgi:hypothetical protein
VFRSHKKTTDQNALKITADRVRTNYSVIQWHTKMNNVKYQDGRHKKKFPIIHIKAIIRHHHSLVCGKRKIGRTRGETIKNCNQMKSNIVCHHHVIIQKHKSRHQSILPIIIIIMWMTAEKATNWQVRRSSSSSLLRTIFLVPLSRCVFVCASSVF